MIEFLKGDLTDASADLVLIPHTTTGNVSKGFQKILLDAGLPERAVSAELGDVNFRTTTSGKFKQIAFICTVDGGVRSFSAVYRGVRKLHQIVDKKISSIAMPFLGSDMKQYHNFRMVIEQSFQEWFKEKIITVYQNFDAPTPVNTEQFINAKTYNAALLVMWLTAKEILQVKWAKELGAAEEFYFLKAGQKFHEFQSYHDLQLDYEVLEKEFKTTSTTYSKYLATLEKKTPYYRFLLVCGELIAYIDRHAYNKNIWNEYENKRTLALSSVNQTRWILGLIAYKKNKNSLNVLSDSIRHALEYLERPANHLTMLSASHRKMAGLTFFGTGIPSQFQDQLLSFFKDQGIGCANQDNDGHLYSRILYAPEIKPIWQEDFSVRPKVSQANPSPNTDEIGETEEIIRRKNLKALMHSDAYAKEDLLEYDIYANILGQMVTSDLCQPPFNISINAPWGKGKTTLMRFIELRIKNLNASRTAETERGVFKRLYNWLADDPTARAITPLQSPTIWFNAWKFQKSEHVWAGLADEIIRQLASQLSVLEREKFWLQLNLKRVDREKLKMELLFHFIKKCTWPIVLGLLSLLWAVFSWMIKVTGLTVPGAITLNAILPVAGLFAAGKSIWAKWTEKLPELDVRKFVLQPEYRSKMGYLQQVEDDLKQAIALIVDKKRPMVVFIDDLDRCAPQFITQLIEAINSFVSGDLSDCFFILGQDPQMVSAALDVAYDTVAQKAGRLENYQGSIGHFFMEKFSQLTLNLPVLDKTRREFLITSLLSNIDLENIPSKNEQQELLTAYNQLEAELETLEDPESIFTKEKKNLEDKILLFQPDRVVSFRRKVLDMAFKSFQLEDNEVENLIMDLSEYLDSPRTIKRFLNLFLFYHFFRFTVPGRSLEKVDHGTLGRWLVLMVRWPLLMQAVQWNTEKVFFNGAEPIDRALKFDQLIKSSATYDNFVDGLTEALKGPLSWHLDPDLYSICKGTFAFEGITLEEIVKVGIW